MMADHDNIDAAFNDLVRTELAAAPPLECECKCNGSEPHSDRLCNGRATMFVTLHRWGWCNEPADAAGFTRPECVDGDGNITSVMCADCAAHAQHVAAAKIKVLIAQLPPSRLRCPTCGRRSQFVDDILTVRPM